MSAFAASAGNRANAIMAARIPSQYDATAGASERETPMRPAVLSASQTTIASPMMIQYPITIGIQSTTVSRLIQCVDATRPRRGRDADAIATAIDAAIAIGTC